MINTQGTLIVRPICANLSRDTDFFTRMDPYCVVICGHQKHRTKIASGAGKTPNWTDQLIFKRHLEDVLQISVYDYDSGSRDDIVGECSVSISRVLSVPNWEDWLELEHRGKRAGQLRLNVTFAPDTCGSHQGFVVYTQPAPYPAYPPGYVAPPAYPAYPPSYPAYPPAPVSGYPAGSYPPMGYPPGYPNPSYPQYQQGYPPYY